MTITDILNRLVPKEEGAQIYVGDHYSIKQLITDLEDLRNEEDIRTDNYDADPRRVLDVHAPAREFCGCCGAGTGEHRRAGEGTCGICDPEGVARNTERNKWTPPDSGQGGL